ncbi:MAG: hypothetical protein V4724_25760 [Pseudomonadota bacterium]
MKLQFKLAALIASVLYSSAPILQAAESGPRSYAVLSLVGDRITTVVARPTSGSNMDTNDKNIIAMQDKVFDESAVQSANAAVKKQQPDSNTVLLLTPDTGLYQAQNDMFDSPGSNADNRTFLKSLLTKRAVSHLILITRVRADTQVRLANSTIGEGKLEGLGFYMNNSLQITSLKTLNSGTGLLAPFAYVKVRLIDADTLEVLREVIQKKAYPVGHYNLGEASLYAWDALTSQQKILCLQAAIKEAMNDAVPKLLTE